MNFKINSHNLLILGICLAIASQGQNCFASVTGPGTIKGHQIQNCLLTSSNGSKRNGYSSNYGFGAGYMYYEEESDFFTAKRKAWDLCLGSFVAVNHYPSRELTEYEQISLYDGNVLEASYFPFSGTFLPGMYFTPGLVFFPSLYAGLGFTGRIQHVQKKTYVSINDRLRPISDSSKRFTAQIAPTLTLGMQFRFYLIDFFGGIKMMSLVGVPSEFSGAATNLHFGMGISFVTLKKESKPKEMDEE